MMRWTVVYSLRSSLSDVKLGAVLAQIGSGSKSNVSMFGVIAVDKEQEAVEMHPLALRER